MSERRFMGDVLLDWLKRAGIIAPLVQHVIIEAKSGEFVTIHVQVLVDPMTQIVDMGVQPPRVEGFKVVTVGKEQ